CNTPECVRLSASVLTRMDIDADPCEDFHEYSCGGFKQKTPLSWQTPRVREDPDELNSRYDAFLIDTLSSSKATSDLGLSVVRRIYQSCVKNDMTMAGVQKSVKELLITDLENSDDNEVNSFTWMLAKSHRDFGASPFFSVFVLKDDKIAIFNRYSDKLIKSLLTAGITVPNFRYLMPSDFYFRKASSDGILQGYLKFYKSTLQYLLGNDTRDLNVSNLNDSLMNSAEFEFRVIQIKGDVSKSSNFRDNLALAILHKAYISYQGQYKGIRLPALGVTDDQLIFILYAQTICENVNERGIDLYYLHDQHINGLPGYLRYIDDVLSINNPKFADYLSSIYPSEFEVKETTETNNSASYVDIMLSYDTDGHMNTSLYDKRDDFNFSITNFPFLSSNIPSSPAYGVFIS
ncbi:hypothetical protein FSP39_002696, partial [Pinctada imbricata]